MDCKSGYFVLSARDAILKMRELAGCEVRHCAFPSNMKKSAYYISERGHLFTVCEVADRYVVFGPKKDKGHYIKGKIRRDGGTSYTMTIDSRHKRLERAEKLVYCSFVLGRWEIADIAIKFKDGDVNNIHPDNLYVSGEVWRKEYGDRMTEFSDLYSQSFDNVVRIVRHKCLTTRENAEDIAQNTFIYLMQRKDGPCNEALWVYWAKRFCRKKWVRNDKRFILIDEFYDRFYSSQDSPYEVDLLKNVRGRDKEYAKLWADGAKPQEIAEIYDISRQAVSQGIHRAKKIIYNELKDEKDQLGY